MNERRSDQRKVKVGVGGVMLKDGQVLMIQENCSNPEYGKQAGMFSIPLGGVEPGESWERAIQREAREETGCETSIEVYLGQVHIPGAIAHLFLLTIEKERLAGELDPRWVAIGEVLNLPDGGVRPPTKAAIQLALCWRDKLR
ncbi:MAG: NUDIX domain-containing protein [Candidatus Nealsonbacteria bacterium]|nr:NUDIX domain-containing protein [Candidatus Nealsonbacteria bacterium]